jgi:serine/threonine protein kinase
MYEFIYLPFKFSREFAELTENLKYKYNNVRPSHFEYYGKLGEGAFGFVIHCKKKSTGKHYAMKIQTKLGLLHNCRDDLAKVNLEKLACASCQHPFIINLDYAFQTDSLAIMVLNLATAGDLNKSLFNCIGTRMDEERVRFYTAEIVLALSYLHQMGLIYRDLKPQNVLLHEDGHIQLVDLGGVRDMRGDKMIQYTSSVPLLSQSFIKHIPLPSNQNSLTYLPELTTTPADATSGTNNSRVTDININTAASEMGELDFHYEKDDVIEALMGGDDDYGGRGEEDRAGDVHANDDANDVDDAVQPSPPKKKNANEERSTRRHRFSVTGTLGYMAPEMVLLLNNHHRKQKQPNKQRQQGGGPAIDPAAAAAAAVVVVVDEDNNKQQWTARHQSRGYTTAVDWWSLGCTMFKLLTGGRPFIDGDPSDIVPVSGDGRTEGYCE